MRALPIDPLGDAAERWLIITGVLGFTWALVVVIGVLKHHLEEHA
jgi:uncharacterized phage-like protein YoqJ